MVLRNGEVGHEGGVRPGWEVVFRAPSVELGGKPSSVERGVDTTEVGV